MEIHLQTEQEKRDCWDKKRIKFTFFPRKCFSKKDNCFKIIWLENVFQRGTRSDDGWFKVYEEI